MNLIRSNEHLKYIHLLTNGYLSTNPHTMVLYTIHWLAKSVIKVYLYYSVSVPHRFNLQKYTHPHTLYNVQL